MKYLLSKIQRRWFYAQRVHNAHNKKTDLKVKLVAAFVLLVFCNAHWWSCRPRSLVIAEKFVSHIQGLIKNTQGAGPGMERREEPTLCPLGTSRTSGFGK